ncbi:proline dehydrogenase domain-containing protein [Sarocladium implicatum]|nr:proline dehydrogenase domain-containing protein [Sarocladium implicatum]
MRKHGIWHKGILSHLTSSSLRSDPPIAVVRRAHSSPEHRYQAVVRNIDPPPSLPARRNEDNEGVLSHLSAAALWRSLLINAIASTPWLLAPSLALLLKLSKPGNMFLLNVERNPILRSIVKQTIYKQYCAGETPSETRATMRSFQDMGFRGTVLTFARETVFDHKKHQVGNPRAQDGVEDGSGWSDPIDKWREGTVKTVELLREGDQLALKMTGAGAAVCAALAQDRPLPQPMCDALHEISRMCMNRGAYILIDAEFQRYQWGIFRVGLLLQREYNRDGRAIIYNTYQAYLKSTQETISQHMQMALDENFTLGIKVVRGAYMATEARELIHDTKADTDSNFDTICQSLLRRDFNGFSHDPGKSEKAFPSAVLLLASHNVDSLMAAYKLHRQHERDSLPTLPVKFALLHGMSDAVSFGLLKLRDSAGRTPEVYKCSTWGPLGECMAYLTRRGLENKDAAMRTAYEYNALRAEVHRRMAFWRRRPLN